MSQVDEGLLHAWLDGQLSPDEAARVERLVASDPGWAAAAGEARGLVAGASRILGALDEVPSAYTAPRQVAASKRPKVSRVSWNAPWLRVAAVLVLTAGVGSAVWVRSPQDPLGERDRVPVAVPAESPQVAPTTAVPGAPAETRVTGRSMSPSAGAAAPAAASADAAKATAEAQPEARRRVDTASARELLARTANELSAQRPVAASPPVPLVEQGVVGVARTDSAAKMLGDARSFDLRLNGCWVQMDSMQTLNDEVTRSRVVTGGGTGSGTGGGRGGRGGRAGADVVARAAAPREEMRAPVAVFRFIAPVVTDIAAVRQTEPPPAPPTLGLRARPAESDVVLLPAATNAQARMLPDSSYVAEFVDARGRTELAFRITGDTLRGTSRLTTNTVALPQQSFIAVRSDCPRQIR